MPSTIAEKYSVELLEMNELIVNYNSEMIIIAIKLNEIIRRDSIEGIAQKIEAFQFLLNRVTNEFHKIQIIIEFQVAMLKKDNYFIEDSQVNDTIGKQQAELRVILKDTVKQYISLKEDCNDFFSNIYNL